MGGPQVGCCRLARYFGKVLLLCSTFQWSDEIILWKAACLLGERNLGYGWWQKLLLCLCSGSSWEGKRGDLFYVCMVSVWITAIFFQTIKKQEYKHPLIFRLPLYMAVHTLLKCACGSPLVWVLACAMPDTVSGCPPSMVNLLEGKLLQEIVVGFTENRNYLFIQGMGKYAQMSNVHSNQFGSFRP